MKGGEKMTFKKGGVKLGKEVGALKGGSEGRGGGGLEPPYNLWT